MSSRTNTTDVLLGCAIAILVLVLISAFSGWLFKLTWNFVMPVMWHQAPVLTFPQAWAATFLLGLVGSAFRNMASS